MKRSRVERGRKTVIWQEKKSYERRRVSFLDITTFLSSLYTTFYSFFWFRFVFLITFTIRFFSLCQTRTYQCGFCWCAHDHGRCWYSIDGHRERFRWAGRQNVILFVALIVGIFFSLLTNILLCCYNYCFLFLFLFLFLFFLYRSYCNYHYFYFHCLKSCWLYLKLKSNYLVFLYCSYIIFDLITLSSFLSSCLQWYIYVFLPFFFSFFLFLTTFYSV